MKKPKVIIISVAIFTKRDYHRFGAEYLESLGYEVELWEVIMGKPVYMVYGEWQYNGDNYYKLNKMDFRQRVAENQEAVYLVVASFYSFIHWILCKYNCKFIFLYAPSAVTIRASSASMPDALSDSLFGRIKRIAIRLIKKESSLKDYFGKVKELLNKYRCKEHPPLAIILPTHYAALQYIPKSALNGNVLYIHSGDYDTYIEMQRIDPKQREKHILYCDGGYADKSFSDVKSGADIESEMYSVHFYREEYYRQMEILFQKLEKYYGVPVVISGHPSAAYEQDSFGGREIIRGKTCELARDAKLFITNVSVAMSFAILYDKPILFVQNEYFKKHVCDENYDNAYSYVKYVTEDLLKVGFINMSNSEEMERPWEKCKKVAEREREKFMREYIIDTDKTDKTIIEYIEEMLQKL